jgi:peptide-methionine (R)-S-oxide reductase
MKYFRLVASVVACVALGIGILLYVRMGRPTTMSSDASRADEAMWRAKLTPEEYHILREAETEAPFSSQLDFETRPGTYVTADCGDPVFRSEQKYDSGTGWPSFWAPVTSTAVVLRPDNSLLVPRTEVLSRCGGHLGHVFEDGPPPTGLRYCMNGLALKFIPDATSTVK